MGGNINLDLFAKNYTSQCGEDGIIEELFKRIGPNNNICVEFGAWDGKYLSNTWNLWANCGWKAILIEGDHERYKELMFTTKDYPNVISLNKWVSGSGQDCLEILLENENIPFDFDLLSIDIDGDDYYVFESLNKYKPRLIVIEFNHTIPLPLKIIQKPNEYFGSSAMAFYNLAYLKGYTLCHMTDGNMFFLRQDEFDKLGIVPPDITILFNKSQLTNIISAYDGRLFITKMPTFVNDLQQNPSIKYKEKTILKIGNYSLNIKKNRKKLKEPPNIIGNEQLIQIEVIKV